MFANDGLDFVRFKRLAFVQRLGECIENRPVLRQHVLRVLVGLFEKAVHLAINSGRGLFAELAHSGEIAAEKHLALAGE